MEPQIGVVENAGSDVEEYIESDEEERQSYFEGKRKKLSDSGLGSTHDASDSDNDGSTIGGKKRRNTIGKYHLLIHEFDYCNRFYNLVSSDDEGNGSGDETDNEEPMNTESNILDSDGVR